MEGKLMDDSLQLKVSKLIASLFKSSRTSDLASLRTALFEGIKQIVHFDGGFLTTRRDAELLCSEDDTYLYNLPGNFFRQFDKKIAIPFPERDLPSNYAINHPNELTTLPLAYGSWQQFEESYLNKHFCKPVGLSDLLGCALRDEKANKYNIIAFYHLDGKTRFSDRDIEVIKVILPFVNQLINTNLLYRFNRHKHVDRKVAILDIHGAILEAEEEFTEFYNTAKLNPKQLLSKLKSSQNRSVTLKLNQQQKVKFSLQDNLIAATALENDSGWAKLSNKQQLICDGLVSGLTNQQIAEQLSLSVNTVNNHLSNIYKALAVKNRAEAISILSK